MIPEEVFSFEIILAAKNQILLDTEITKLIKKKKGWKRLNAKRRAQLVREAYILGRDDIKAEKNGPPLFMLLPKNLKFKAKSKFEEPEGIVVMGRD